MGNNTYDFPTFGNCFKQDIKCIDYHLMDDYLNKMENMMKKRKVIWDEFLIENNIDEQYLISLTNLNYYEGERIVLGYISHLDGLGSKESDVDLYAFCRGDDKKDRIINMHNYKNILIDIEYWNLDGFLNDIKKKEYRKDIDLLKIIQRINSGIVICGNSDSFLKIIEEIDIRKEIILYYNNLSNAFYDDAVKMYNSKNYYSALLCAKNALNYAAGGHNAIKGIANLKEKWIPRILIDNIDDVDDKFVKRYLFYLTNGINDKEELQCYLKDLLEFTSECLVTNEFF